LLSVSDKSGLVEFAQRLHAQGVTLIASGGTARTIAGAGVPVTPVETLTNFPEILGGRVKTLHPAVHGGILARDTPEHLAELEAHGLAPIDLVVVNLYPFAETVRRSDVTEAEAVEQIDIGGVALLRAAAKNYERVSVCCDPADYNRIATALETVGEVSVEERRRLALKAFRHTAAYDAAITTYLTGLVGETPTLPSVLHLVLEREQTLRYGENPHQAAAFYRWQGAEPAFRQLQGKPLSFNNLIDLDAAWALVNEFDAPTVAIIKHTNPCGCASAATLAEAYPLALASDPVSAFGSIIAVNRELDLVTVEAIGKLFVEVIVAPGYTDEALSTLSHKKNLRVMLPTAAAEFPLTLRTVQGGLLVQTPDTSNVADLKVVTRRQPTSQEMEALCFAWRVCKHVKSNAIVFAKGAATVGVGAGQMSRVDAVELAAKKAGEKAKGAVMASDAFFPFPDGVEAAAAAGVTAVIQPGGSVRDEEVIAAADRLGLAMVFTGMRHFRH